MRRVPACPQRGHLASPSIAEMDLRSSKVRSHALQSYS